MEAKNEIRAEEMDPKNIFYPPGGILLWIIISLETLTFVIGIAVFLHEKKAEPELFSRSQALLSPVFGMVNTLVLLTGGFMMASSVRQLKVGNSKKSLFWIYAAAAMGLAFLCIKGFEYYEKLGHGLTIDFDSFFTFYWLLTGFHFIHVLVATVILLGMARGIKKGSYNKSVYADVESGAAFWHMCDLIWLLLFPVLYLLH